MSTIVAFLALACAGPSPPVATPPGLLQLGNGSTLYCPEVLANAGRPRPGASHTPTPSATATITPTPTPRLLLSRTPSAGIPPEDMVMIVEAVRLGRGLEPSAAVVDDPLMDLSGNRFYGAQLQPLIEIDGYRIMETALAIMVETPQGEIWVHQGYSWVRIPLPWLTVTATPS